MQAHLAAVASSPTVTLPPSAPVSPAAYAARGSDDAYHNPEWLRAQLETYARPREWSRELADELTGIAYQQLLESSDYKRQRWEKIRAAEDMYLGKVKPKLKIQFNVPVPVLSGMVDTLLANINDPVRLRFKHQDAADYKAAKKIQAAYEIESDSPNPEARWALKDRMAKRDAMFAGRAIYKCYASSHNGYQNHLDHVPAIDFHAEPEGGPILEKHLYCGQEGIMRTREALAEGALAGTYDMQNVNQLCYRTETTRYRDYALSNLDQRMARFRALGMDPSNHNYVGQVVFHLVEWYMEAFGRRWYVLFDPWTKLWVRCTPLKELFSNNLYPYATWATHEDGRLFWSKAVATDDLYPVADAIHTMVNQELHNRQKRNMGARAFDPAIFFDEERLESAFHRPDALVPANTKNGTIEISKGIYQFETPELTGTINLVSYLESMAGKHTGVTDSVQGQATKDKRVGVFYGEIDAVSKLFDYRSQSYSEAWGEVGVRYVGGLKDHMSEPIAIEVLGETGLEWKQLKRVDLSLTRNLGITVTSSAADAKKSAMQAERQANALGMVKDLVNPRWFAAQTLAGIGEFDDAAIADALDMTNYADKELMAEASEAIQLMLQGKPTTKNFGATAAYLQRIQNYAEDHRDAMDEAVFDAFIEYIVDHAPIAAKNAQRQIMQAMGQIPGMGGPQMGPGMPVSPGMVPGQPQAPVPAAGAPMAPAAPTAAEVAPTNLIPA